MTTWPEAVAFGFFMLGLVAMVYLVFRRGITVNYSESAPAPRRRVSAVDRLTDAYIKAGMRRDKRVDRLIKKLTDAGYHVSITHRTVRREASDEPTPLVTPPPDTKDRPN